MSVEADLSPNVGRAPAAGAGCLFLRPETKIEPLVCGWYAWSHLLSPVQHALNVAYRHIPLLQSFVRNPGTHLAAARDPAMFGGPFMHLPVELVADAKRLLAETTSRCSRLLSFAAAMRSTDERLLGYGRGHSLSRLYDELPENLRGLVEFLYDLNNQPRLRVFEELVYDEDLCSDSQDVMLSLEKEGDRKFFMSTPRLGCPDSVTLKLPFSDVRLDLLASMRTHARRFEEVQAAFGIDDDRAAGLRRFFTVMQPRRAATEYTGGGVRMRYFGHACVLLQTRNTAILMDPMFACEPNESDGRFTFSDLPDYIDYVVISHNHQDHFAPEMLLQLRHKIGTVIVPGNNSGSIADPSMRLALRQLGIADVQTLGAFDQVQLVDGAITSLPFPGEHVDLEIHSRHGIHIGINGRSFAFLVDSDGRDPDLFKRIVRRVGARTDALFIGMECHGAPLSWLYGPLLTKPISRRDDDSRRLSGLDSQRALKVVQEFSASRVFVYAMGQEPWMRYIMGLEYTPDSIQLREVTSFLESCRNRGISAEQLFISRELEF